MDLKSIIPDERIEAANALVELTIEEYLAIAPYIIDKNEYQRKKVIKSKIKQILREDLLKGCSIPPIVLSVQTEGLGEGFDYKRFNDASIIKKAFEEKALLIIDGLQRTYVLLELEEDLKKDKNEEALKRFLSNKIRSEIYVGLSRLGILYRMITLNTGQTTMSTRHLMEILYFDYQGTGIGDIKFIKDKDEEKVSLTTSEFKFKETLDGFNSYLERDENLINRTEILDNIKTLNTLSNEGYKKDLFALFISTYKKFLDVIVDKAKHWEFNQEDIEGPEYALKSTPFGKTPIEIFKRSQAFTGFGAALGLLKFNKSITIEDVSHMIDHISLNDGDFQTCFYLILKHLDTIKERSKKIGNDQRFYFRSLFQNLFDSESEYRLKFDEAIEAAFNRTRADKLS